LADLPRAAALVADRSVRLRHQANDLMPAGKQGFERRLGKSAGAHHDDAHGINHTMSPQRHKEKKLDRKESGHLNTALSVSFDHRPAIPSFANFAFFAVGNDFMTIAFRLPPKRSRFPRSRESLPFLAPCETPVRRSSPICARQAWLRGPSCR